LGAVNAISVTLPNMPFEPRASQGLFGQRATRIDRFAMRVVGSVVTLGDTTVRQPVSRPSRQAKDEQKTWNVYVR